MSKYTLSQITRNLDSIELFELLQDGSIEITRKNGKTLGFLSVQPPSSSLSPQEECNPETCESCSKLLKVYAVNLAERDKTIKRLTSER